MFKPALHSLFSSLFGANAYLAGVPNVAIGLRRSPGRDRSSITIIQGRVGIAADVLAFVWPNIMLLALLAYIAVWALVTGVFELVAAVRRRRVIAGEWLLALSRVMSIVLGILLIASPAIGALGLASYGSRRLTPRHRGSCWWGSQFA